MAERKNVKIVGKRKYRRVTQRELMNALIEADGNMAGAAEILGCHINTVYQRVKKDPKLQEICEEGQEIINEIAQWRLNRRVRAGDWRAICFQLKMRERRRMRMETMRTINMTLQSAQTPGYTNEELHELEQKLLAKLNTVRRRK